MLLGTVADRFMAGASCPLAIAPRGYATTEPGLGTVGVAYNDRAGGIKPTEMRDSLAMIAAQERTETAPCTPDGTPLRR